LDQILITVLLNK